MTRLLLALCLLVVPSTLGTLRHPRTTDGVHYRRAPITGRHARTAAQETAYLRAMK